MWIAIRLLHSKFYRFLRKRVWTDKMNNLEIIKKGGDFLYNAPELMEAKARCREMISRLNDLSDTDASHKAAICKELFGSCGENLTMKPPFYCDYGFNIHVGNNVLINFQCTFIDAGPITIGDNTLIGPQCGFYCINHDIDPEKRNAAISHSKPITIGKDCWFGGNCTVVPGVTIGDGCVIGAGSVVTKDIPPYSIAVGNPAKVISSVKEN